MKLIRGACSTLAFLLVAIPAAVHPPGAAAVDHPSVPADAQRTAAELGDDAVVPPLPKRPPGAPRLGARATQGWTPLQAGYRYKTRPTYKLRIVAGAEQARALAEDAVLRDPYVDITVAPGTVQRTTPRSGEILLMISETSPCSKQDSTWIGCGGPNRTSWVKGSNYTRIWANAGKVWLRPNLFTDTTLSAADRLGVVLHELGHVQGLGHFAGTYQGTQQVMYPSVNGISAYQAGDRHGLSAARPLEKGYRNFRTGAISAARFQGATWLIGTDAEGKVWARKPLGHGRYAWSNIGGVLSGSPAITVRNGQMAVYGVGTDGHLWRNVRQSGKWSGWALVASPSWTGGVSAVVDSAGQVHVYGRATADRSAQQETQTASGWVLDSNLGGTLVGDLGSLYLPSSGAFSIWGVGTNGVLYQENWIPGSGWSGWAPVSGSPSNLAGPVSMIRDARGRYRLSMVNTYGSIQHAIWTPGSGWSWRVRKASVRGRVGMLPVPHSARIEVFAPDLSGHVRTSRQTRHGWTRLTVVKPG